MTPSAAPPSVPSIRTSSATRRWLPAPLSLTGPRSTLLCWRRLCQTRCDASANGASRSSRRESDISASHSSARTRTGVLDSGSERLERRIESVSEVRRSYRPARVPPVREGPHEGLDVDRDRAAQDRREVRGERSPSGDGGGQFRGGMTKGAR